MSLSGTSNGDYPPREPDSPSTGPPRKRKRKTFACKTCRNRKLKCDQLFPQCTRCQKGGATCIYGRDDEEDPAGSAAGHIRASFSRFARPPEIESNRDGIGFPIHPAITNVRIRGEDSDERPGAPETMVFKGKEFKTQFWGPTNAISPIIHFPELRTFMTEGMGGGARLARMQTDIRDLKNKMKRGHLRDMPGIGTTLQQMQALIPSRAETLSIVQVYWDQIESTYRILHGPSFWGTLEELWSKPEGPPEAFVAITVLVLALGRLGAPNYETMRYAGASSTVREFARKAVDLASTWLEKHSKKHTTMEFFQVSILLHLTKSTALIKKKRIWEDARMMVTNALAAGLHREPSLLGSRISVFQQEMRRRLWATMVEFDLQSSLDRGMLSSLVGIHWDCAPPSNLDDSELSVDMATLPKCKPSEQYTECSFLRWCQKTAELRLSLITTLNSSPVRLAYDEVIAYEERLSCIIEKLPDWKPKFGVLNTDSRETVNSLLKVQLNQFLALVHSAFLYHGGTPSQESYSALASLNAATSVITGYNALSASSFLHILVNSDILRTGLSIAQTVCTSSAFERSALLQNLVPVAILSADQALGLQYESVMRLGEGVKEFWYLTCACGVLRLRSEPKTDQKQAAMDRTAAIYYRFIGSQEDLYGVSSVAGSGVDGGFSSLSTSTNHPTPPMPPPSLSQESTPLNSHHDLFAAADPNAFDITELANWTLSDAWTFEF
jgi:hypothetical protein